MLRDQVLSVLTSTFNIQHSRRGQAAVHFIMEDKDDPTLATTKQSKQPLFFEDSEPDSDDQNASPSTSKPTSLNGDKNGDTKVKNPQAPTTPTTTHNGGANEQDTDGDFFVISPPRTSSRAQPIAGPSRSPDPSSHLAPTMLDSLSQSDFYIGEYFCNGWSLNKGKGYCTPGSRIHVERTKSQEEKYEERKMKNGLDVGQVRVGGPTVITKGGKGVKGETKQTTLGAMGIGKKPVSVLPL